MAREDGRQGYYTLSGSDREIFAQRRIIALTAVQYADWRVSRGRSRVDWSEMERAGTTQKATFFRGDGI